MQIILRVCQGYYDTALIKAWEAWDENRIKFLNHCSENDHPKAFPENQFTLEGKQMLHTFESVISIMDFTPSRINTGEAILFLDLSSDPDLFNGPKSTQIRIWKYSENETKTIEYQFSHGMEGIHHLE